MTEKRGLHRYRSLKAAQLFDCATGSYSDCSIVDVNSRGARLRLRKMPQTLGSIEVLFVPENVRVPATAVWLRGNQCGVRFGRPVRFLARHDKPPQAEVVNNRPLA